MISEKTSQPDPGLTVTFTSWSGTQEWPEVLRLDETFDEQRAGRRPTLKLIEGGRS